MIPGTVSLILGFTLGSFLGPTLGSGIFTLCLASTVVFDWDHIQISDWITMPNKEELVVLVVDLYMAFIKMYLHTMHT